MSTTLLVLCCVLALGAAITTDLLAVHAARRRVQTAADAAALAAAQVVASSWREELGENGLTMPKRKILAAACRAVHSSRTRARDRAEAYLEANGGVRLEGFRLTADGQVEIRAAAPVRFHVARPARVLVVAAAAARPYFDSVAFPGCR